MALRVICMVCMLVGVTSTVFADDDVSLEQLELSVKDISDVIGLDIYKFRVPVNAGAKFEVVISEQFSLDSPVRVLFRSEFSNDSEADVVNYCCHSYDWIGKCKVCSYPKNHMLNAG